LGLPEATGGRLVCSGTKGSLDEQSSNYKNQKEVDELKKIVFPIIGILLVLGLVLPGCGGVTPPPTEHFITIAVAGPMTDIQGQNHWNGATMAADEINAAGGVSINGTTYTIKLVKVETKESTEGEDGSTGTANLQAVIDTVDFVVGGFRTEVVSVYREVAMAAHKIFFNCGAATGSLQFSVVTNYDKYKYWFKSTPYNETFLVKSLFKINGSVAGVLKATLAGLDAASNGTYVKDEFKVPADNKLRVHILMENAAWAAGMVAAAKAYLPLLGFTVTGTTLVSPTATSIDTEMNAIKALNPHIIFTAFSGPVGAVYSRTKASLGIPALTIGINVPGQELDHWANTDGTCEGEIMLDTWAVGVANTAKTVAWFNNYVTKFGVYPGYCAATYDAINNMVLKAMKGTGSLDPAVLIPWLEDPANTYTEGVSFRKIGYYPMPAITITDGQLYALSEAQVKTLYPNIDGPWLRFSPATPPYYFPTAGYAQSDWMCGFVSGVQQPHIAHDLVYSPDLSGIGSQWQIVSGQGTKVGVWPKQLYPSDTPTATLVGAGLIDQYGNWNYQYAGTAKLILPIGNMLNIPWDAYAHAV
jgi:branched-chain amino acid transport system substrate-binding protein